jgi:ribosomal protein S16
MLRRGAPVKGRSVEDLGHYNPHTNVFEVAKDKVEGWLKQGVKPSATVHNLLVEHGIMKGEKVTSWKPKNQPSPEASAGTGKQGETATAPAPTAPAA